MRLGSLGFLEILLPLIALALPIWATIVVLQRNDYSLTNTNKILLLLLTWLIGLIGPIITLLALYSDDAQETNPLDY